MDILKTLFIKDDEGNYYQFVSHRWYTMHTNNTKKYIIRKIQEKLHLNINTHDVDNYIIDEYFNIKRDPPHLLCFKNGVYDMNTNQFRDGKYDDYCTYSTYTHYNYQTNHNLLNNMLYQLCEIPKQFLSAIYALYKGYPIIIHKTKIFNAILLHAFGEYGAVHDKISLMERKLYHMITNLEYLINHFKGKFIQLYDNKKYIVSTSALAKMDTTLSCKILINKQHKGLYRNLSTTITHTYASELINKMIDIDQSCTKIQLFRHNNMFISDVTNYILYMYDTILYL